MSTEDTTKDIETDETGAGMYPDVDAANVENVRVENEMEQSYIDYAMSVIAGRALPDVRDGLKPVHRRILYSMEYEGITASSGHRKSSSVVGTAMGNWHPHGDSAIYDALVRMAQDFSMRYPLVDGQGNFGSLDGDPPAAMRYTEARMSPLAEEMLADIEKDTVDWMSSYDDRLNEPEVLPAGFPNLLVNGSSGIAVGMSTNIPPHNLGEVVDAAVTLIENPGATVTDLMEHIEGPDFPTGGIIAGRDPIHRAYEEGRGKLTVRGVVNVDDEAGRIVVDEIPYQVDKSKLIENIADCVRDEKIEGVRDIRDESDRDGVRVVVELKRDAVGDVVRNQLFEHTRLERTFGVINLSLVDGQPRVLSLKEMLREYLDHRRKVVRRRSQHELDEAEQRAHVLEGRLVAIDNAEDVVDTIRDTEDRDEAKVALTEGYDLTEEQAEHVVRMQLGSLTSLERGDVEDELEGLYSRIERLKEILGDENELMGVVKEELLEIKEEYADDRRTRIEESEEGVTREDLIPERDDVVVLTKDGYAKRMPVDDFDTQKRGGKGIIGAKPKEGDEVSKIFVANTHDYVLCFTDKGRVHRLKTYEIPEMGRTARGRSVVNLLNLESDEEVTAVVNTEDFTEKECFLMVTREGMVNRTCASDFSNILSTGINAIKLNEGDELVDVVVTTGDDDLVIGTRDGYAIRFDESEVSKTGRYTVGVNGVKLRDGDEVAGVDFVENPEESTLLTVAENGYGKRTPLGEYSKQSRYGYGNIDIKTDERNGEVVSLTSVSDGDDLVVMSSEGKIMRTTVDDITKQGRNTMGVTVMSLEPGDGVATVASVKPDGDTDGGSGGAGAGGVGEDEELPE